MPRELVTFDNEKDMGMKPACGLLPPKIVDSQVVKQAKVTTPPGTLISVQMLRLHSSKPRYPAEIKASSVVFFFKLIAINTNFESCHMSF